MVSLSKIGDLKRPRASWSLRQAGALTRPAVWFRSWRVRQLRTYRAGPAGCGSWV